VDDGGGGDGGGGDGDGGRKKCHVECHIYVKHSYVYVNSDSAGAFSRLPPPAFRAPF